MNKSLPEKEALKEDSFSIGNESFQKAYDKIHKISSLSGPVDTYHLLSETQSRKSIKIVAS